MEKIIEEVLKDERFKSILREVMAHKVADEYHYTDSEGELIKQEIRDLIKAEAKTMIKDVTENYYTMSSIKDQIEEEIKRMSKQNIIDILSNKLN